MDCFHGCGIPVCFVLHSFQPSNFTNDEGKTIPEQTYKWH